jgi:hypothetical protein
MALDGWAIAWSRSISATNLSRIASFIACRMGPAGFLMSGNAINKGIVIELTK